MRFPSPYTRLPLKQVLQGGLPSGLWEGGSFNPAVLDMHFNL